MNLLIEKKNRILRLTLNRPAKCNALTSDMCKGIVEAVDSAQDDEDVGCVLITAVGQVFCSGMDLDEAVSPEGRELAEIHEKLFTMGARSLKPIVVSANGAALGGGLGLLAQGHEVVAERSSLFGLPEIRIGLWPFLIYRSVEAALGVRRTLALSLTGRTFSAQDAQAWGLVRHVCPDDEVEDHANSVARDLAKACPAAIEAGMMCARDSRGKSWEQAGEIASALRDRMMDSDDFAEGCAAFKEKREPYWPSMPKAFYADRKKSGRQPMPTGKR